MPIACDPYNSRVAARAGAGTTNSDQETGFTGLPESECITSCRSPFRLRPNFRQFTPHDLHPAGNVAVAPKDSHRLVFGIFICSMTRQHEKRRQ
jgi:hypothetical protein